MNQRCFLLLVLCFSAKLHADLMPYIEDFDALDISSPTVLFDTGGWEFFNIGNSTNPLTAYEYAGQAPNGPQISSLLAEFGGQHLNIFSDYHNTDAHPGPAGVPVEVNVQRILFFNVNDIGSTWSLAFDFAGAIENGVDFSPTGATTTSAFLGVFDVNFNRIDEKRIDTTNAPDAPNFASATLTQFFDPAWGITEGFVQFGFNNVAANNDNSGIYYDNIRFTQVPEPTSAALMLLLFAGAGGRSWWRRRVTFQRDN